MTDSDRVIVIGTGPAGAIAALRLTQRGVPVTMLESGSHFAGGLMIRMMGKTLFRRQPALTNQGYIASGDSRTSWYTFLSPGGLSNQWTGAVPRFAPDDFHEGARLHEKYRWPIGYDDLAPYYDSVERLLQVTSGPDTVPNLPASKPRYCCRLPDDWRVIAKSAESRGHGLTTMPIVDGGPWMLARRGTAFNSFTRIVRKLEGHRHFQLVTGAHVLWLVWSGKEKRGTEVIYCNRADGSQQRLKAAAIVLASGSLASTKILLNSISSDFPHGLGNSHGVLGKYLHDHPKEWWAVDLDKPLSRLKRSAYLTRAPYQDSFPLLAAQCTIGYVSMRDNILSLLPSQVKAIGVNVFGTMRPTECNYVGLHTDARDEYGLPLLDIRIKYDDDAVQNMGTARDRFLEIFAQAGYCGQVREVVPQLAPGTSVHYGGTVRMHHSPEYGLLDGWNRVHEVPNVIVADASCFTTAVEKNPTLTAMAIAARAADRLADDLMKG